MATKREIELEKRVAVLEESVAKLLAENAELKRRLGMDSNNSSKPPSSDGLKAKPKSLRKSGGKKGGQPGHKGTTLMMSDTPDEIIALKPKICPHCLQNQDNMPVVCTNRAQVHDLPEWKVRVKEYQSTSTRCTCGHINCGTFPEGVVPGAQYGKRIKALLVNLNVGQFIPLARCCELLSEISDVQLCQATVLSALSEMEERIVPYEATIRENLLKSPVINSDETGARVDKILNWLHSVSNQQWTLYDVHRKRGFEAIEAIGLLPEYRGILVHDFFKPYLKLDVDHAFCCAHLMRECQGITDNSEQLWSGKMKTLLSNLWERTKVLREDAKRFAPRELKKWYGIYDSIVNLGFFENANAVLGKRGGKPKELCLLERFRDYKKAILRFMYNPSVPFDNNQAERDIRMVKVKSKVSGAFRTEAGARQFARIRGFISTLRKQHRNVLESLVDALIGEFAWVAAE